MIMYYSLALCIYNTGKVSLSTVFLEKAHERISSDGQYNVAEFNIECFIAMNYARVGQLQISKTKLLKCLHQFE